MTGIVSKILVLAVLVGATVAAYGGSFYGWFLPKSFDKPVSLREGSAGTRTGHGPYFIGGRSHYGGGYRGGK